MHRGEKKTFVFVNKISVSANWFMKLMGLEKLKTFIKRNNYIYNNLWQKFAFYVFILVCFPLTFPVFFLFIQMIVRKLLEFEGPKIKTKVMS